MPEYRLGAVLFPALLLLVLPALAAYPWQIPLGEPLALPFLTLITILFGTLRYPGLFFSPLVFISGILCDLFTRSPLGFWTLLFLLTLACARTASLFYERYGRLAYFSGFVLTLIFITSGVWGLSSLYQFHWQDWRLPLEGLIMGLVLLPAPALLLVGLEKLFIFKSETKRAKTFGSRPRYTSPHNY